MTIEEQIKWMNRLSEINIKYVKLIGANYGDNLNYKMVEYLVEKYIPEKEKRREKFEYLTGIEKKTGWKKLMDSYNERKMETYIRVSFGLGITHEEAVAWVSFGTISLFGDNALTLARKQTLELLNDEKIKKLDETERVERALDYYKEAKRKR